MRAADRNEYSWIAQLKCLGQWRVLFALAPSHHKTNYFKGAWSFVRCRFEGDVNIAAVKCAIDCFALSAAVFSDHFDICIVAIISANISYSGVPPYRSRWYSCRLIPFSRERTYLSPRALCSISRRVYCRCQFRLSVPCPCRHPCSRWRRHPCRQMRRVRYRCSLRLSGFFVRRHPFRRHRNHPFPLNAPCLCRLRRRFLCRCER